MATADTRPIHERCWCWQYGRCLTDCPTADHPGPTSWNDLTWRREALALASQKRADLAKGEG